MAGSGADQMSTGPDQDITPGPGAALAGACTSGNALIRDESTPGGHALCDAEITRLRARLQVLAKEHARHSLAVSVHQGRADQQESRAVHAEKQLHRLGEYVARYDELAEQAAAGQRAADLVAELRRRLAPMERMQGNLRSAEAKLAEMRTELEHCKAALAGDNEGGRLWMIDCGLLVEKHRKAATEAAAAERERVAKLAEQVDAFYDAPCPDSVPGCIHQDAPFANLIRRQP